MFSIAIVPNPRKKHGCYGIGIGGTLSMPKLPLPKPELLGITEGMPVGGDE